MRKILSTIAVSAVLSASLFADFARVEMGAGAWMQTPSGTADYNAGAGVTGNNTFNEEQEISPYVWMLIKHPIPIVPNLRVEYVSIHATGTATGAWAGFAIPGSSNSVLDIKEYDIIPYYNILDNTFWVTIDLGLDLKVMNLDYTVAQNGLFPGYEDSYTAPIPLLYARARVEIPTTDIGLESDVKYITTGSSTIYDVRAKIDYTFDITPLIQPALEVGYRVQKIQIDEDGTDVKTDMDFAGVYAGLMLRF